MGVPQEFLDVVDAQRLVSASITPAPIIELPLRAAVGRTLAADIHADIDDPPFDRAVMDGYALRSTDVTGTPCELSVMGQIAAGQSWEGQVQPGQAVQINTGAAMPAGVDAVVQVELTTPLDGGGRVRVNAAVKPGLNITPRGTHIRSGQVVLKQHMRLRAAHVAVAAVMGAARVPVFSPARAAILSTGDELVDIDQTPSGSQIRNSNSYLLEALCLQAGAVPIPLGIARDEYGELEPRIRAGLTHDVLLITGGISMGAFDLVPEVLRRCGVDIQFRKMAIRPGKPTLFGISDFGSQVSDSSGAHGPRAASDSRCAVFALPGNPVSAFMGFWLLVRTALAAREGRSDTIQAPRAARLDGTLKPTTDRRSYIPARLTSDAGGQLIVTPTLWHGSGDPFGLVEADTLIVRAPHAPAAGEGETVDVLTLEVL